jgi:intraflagellar transport protein 81
MNPNELKKQISQMEQERTQLMQKINIFKNKNTDKPEFQALLEVTNMLRKEQEEEARLSEKVHIQRQ